MMLHELAFPNSNPHDLNEIAFAMEVFEEEAKKGNKFTMDCSSVLKGLHFFVEALPKTSQSLPAAARLARADANSASAAPLQASSQSQVLGAGQTGLPGDSHILVEENDVLQMELQAWLDDDYFELYNDFPF